MTIPEMTFFGDSLTDDEIAAFKLVRDGDLCVVRCTLNGVQRAAICSSFLDDNGDVLLYPLSLIATEEEIEALIGPDGSPTEEITNVILP